MKFIVSSLKLLKNLQALSGVIGTKNTLPILDDFLFQLTENELKITTSDLDVTMSVSMVPDMVEGTGEVTIPARLLLEIMKNFPDVPITINVDNNTLAVELIAGEGRYKLAGHKSDEFPQLPVMTDTSVWEIPADVLARGFEKTVFATGTSVGNSFCITILILSVFLSGNTSFTISRKAPGRTCWEQEHVTRNPPGLSIFIARRLISL